jgi:hypothetical protein
MTGHFLNFFFNSTIRRIALPALCFSGALGAVAACGADEQPASTGVLPPREKPATKTVTVNVGYPDDNVRNTTNSIHVWFIEKDDSGANCADLVGGATDPNSGPLTHLGDFVSKGASDSVEAKGVVGGGPTLVYVEAVDDNGQVEWAGCVELGRGSSVTIDLTKARVYDCAPETAKNGLPCDDGDPCTVGESCRDHECKSGVPRDCTALDGDCSVGQCDAVEGCIKVPFNDGGTCSDDLYCTTEDKCASGDCVGTPVNCDTDSGGCRVGSVCSESSLGSCTTGTIQPYGTACDDGLFCTTSDQCDFSGNCVGTQMDCSASGGCSTCSETTHTCSDPAPTGTFCSDNNNCTTSDQCNASGSCVGQPRDCSSSAYQYGGCRVGVCDATFGGCTSVTVVDGTSCDDGYPCTTGDHCVSGSCQYTTLAVSGTPCGAPCLVGGTCSGASVTCSNYLTTAPSGTPCDDGNPCTVSDICSGSTCYGPSYATVGTPCTMAGCPNGAQCGSSGRCACR